MSGQTKIQTVQKLIARIFNHLSRVRVSNRLCWGVCVTFLGRLARYDLEVKNCCSWSGPSLVSFHKANEGICAYGTYRKSCNAWTRYVNEIHMCRQQWSPLAVAKGQRKNGDFTARQATENAWDFKKKKEKKTRSVFHSFICADMWVVLKIRVKFQTNDYRNVEDWGRSDRCTFERQLRCAIMSASPCK